MFFTLDWGRGIGTLVFVFVAISYNISMNTRATQEGSDPHIVSD